MLKTLKWFEQSTTTTEPDKIIVTPARVFGSICMYAVDHNPSVKQHDGNS